MEPFGIYRVHYFYSSITSSKRGAHYFSFILPLCSPLVCFLFPLNTRHSADPCEQLRRRQVRTKPREQLQSAFLSRICTTGPVCAHADKISTLGIAFLPSHPPPIHPLSHQCIPSHLGRFSRNTQAWNRWPSDYSQSSPRPLPFCASRAQRRKPLIGRYLFLKVE